MFSGRLADHFRNLLASVGVGEPARTASEEIRIASEASDPSSLTRARRATDQIASAREPLPSHAGEASDLFLLRAKRAIDLTASEASDLTSLAPSLPQKRELGPGSQPVLSAMAPIAHVGPWPPRRRRGALIENKGAPKSQFSVVQESKPSQELLTIYIEQKQGPSSQFAERAGSGLEAVHQRIKAAWAGYTCAGARISTSISFSVASFFLILPPSRSATRRSASKCNAGPW